jgi:hypothetical protein
MKNLIKLMVSALAVLSLSGCYTILVKKDNVSSFETWNLCTLLYKPHQLYTNWKVDEDENSLMEIELKKRGIHSSKSCEIMEISKRQCSDYGFNINTDGHVNCTQKTFNQIKDKISNFKDKKSKNKSGGSSFAGALSAGMSGAAQGMTQAIHKNANEPTQTFDFQPKPRNIMCPDGKWAYGTRCRMLPDGRWAGE